MDLKKKKYYYVHPKLILLNFVVISLHVRLKKKKKWQLSLQQAAQPKCFIMHEWNL